LLNTSPAATGESHNGPDPSAVYRMRFLDLAPDSLRWTWERSTDGGSTFEELWRLRYERAWLRSGYLAEGKRSACVRTGVRLPAGHLRVTAGSGFSQSLVSGH
jgi:hypothetical protein